MVTPLIDNNDKTSWAATKKQRKAFIRQQVEDDNVVRTDGWIMWDKLVHGGVNGVLNIAASIYMVHDRANYHLDKAARGEKNKFFKPEEITSELKASLDNRYALRTGGAKKTALQKFYDWGDKLEDNVSSKILGLRGLQDYHKNDDIQRGLLDNMTIGFARFVPSITFLSWGGWATNFMMLALEQPAIKTRGVRFLDNVNERWRKFRGNEITEDEKFRKEVIYEKLDSELSGKTFIGTVASRIFGLLGIMSVGALGEAVDKTYIGKNNVDRNESGLLRVTQIFMEGSRFVQGVINPGLKNTKNINEWNPAYLQDPKKSIKAAFGNEMAIQSSIEVAGTGFTTTVQYLFLMGKELFGIGMDTNIKDKTPSVEESKITASRPQGIKVEAKIQPKVEAKIEEAVKPKAVGAKQIVEKTASEAAATPKVVKFAEKTKPAATGYQNKVKLEAETPALQEQGV